MERSTIQVLAKRGKSIRQIAQELGHSPTTIARVLKEPVEVQPARRQRRSQVDPYRAQIVGWIQDGLSVVRMLEVVRADPVQPYRGSRSQFGEMVRRIRLAVAQAEAATTVPVRFEGLPGEYLQVDWGEVRAFPFTQAPAGTRYFLACRLKYSRWVWVRWTTEMRQEILFRGLVACLVSLGWVPWVLVFDNMKTVTSGRDPAGQPVWTPALLQLAGECGFHPQACDPGAPNQKGSVESLVKWVKGNLLPGRHFADDADLAEQTATWQMAANQRPSSATGVPPLRRLAEEAQAGGRVPASLRDYGLCLPGRVSAEALVAVAGNRYSVPVAHVGAPVIIRLHQERVRVWRDGGLLADHRRAPDGARQRVVDPAHFAPLFLHKPRGQAMLYRDHLVGLGGRAPAFLSQLSRQQRDRLPAELRAIYTLYTRVGPTALLAAMAQADTAGAYTAAALELLLESVETVETNRPGAALALPGVPTQPEIDRQLRTYESWVVIDVALPADLLGGGR